MAVPQNGGDVRGNKKDKELCDYIKEHTGLVVDAYFSATKIKWVLENVPGARILADAGQLLFGTVETWLIWNLTGGQVHVTTIPMRQEQCFLTSISLSGTLISAKA